MHLKNSTAQPAAQPLVTTEVDFLETPTSNQGDQLLSVIAGSSTQDALQAARTLASGTSQLLIHVYDSVNHGELVHCDCLKTLAFVSEVVTALVCATQKGVEAAGRGADQ